MYQIIKKQNLGYHMKNTCAIDQIKNLLTETGIVTKLVTTIEIIKNNNLFLNNINIITAFSKLRERCKNDLEFNKYNWIDFLLSVTLEKYPSFFTAIILAICNNYPIDNLKKLVIIVALHEQNNKIIYVTHSLTYNADNNGQFLFVPSNSSNCVFCNLYDYYKYDTKIIQVRENYNSLNNSITHYAKNQIFQVQNEKHLNMISNYAKI